MRMYFCTSFQPAWRREVKTYSIRLYKNQIIDCLVTKWVSFRCLSAVIAGAQGFSETNFTFIFSWKYRIMRASVFMTMTRVWRAEINTRVLHYNNNNNMRKIK